MTMKHSPAIMADKPAKRMRVDVVIFILFSLIRGLAIDIHGLVSFTDRGFLVTFIRMLTQMALDPDLIDLRLL
jgi:hypothetical protein